MKPTVLFLQTQRDIIALSRYLRMVAPLARRGIAATWCDTARSMAEDVERLRAELGVNLPFLPIDHARRPIPSGAFTRVRAPRIERGETARSRSAAELDLAGLIADIGLDNRGLIRGFRDALLPGFHRHHEIAGTMLDELRPDLVVYDIEHPQAARAFLLACRDRGIATLSMEHCEGYCEQYGNFPVMADVYVAYGEYNRTVLRRMGVADERIFTTGSPDTDALVSLDRTALKRKFCERYGLRGAALRLLVGLRPFRIPAYAVMNEVLLRGCETLRSTSNNVEVLVKIHPGDHPMTSREIEDRIEREHPSFHAIDYDIPMAHVLAACDRFTTYNSGSIVEAILLDVPLLVLQKADGGAWPLWEKFGVYPVVSEDGFPAALKRFLDEGERVAAERREKREAFIRHFRYRLDDLAAERISEVIERLICERRAGISEA